MKLDEYLRMWQADGEKMLYPYELFSTISELRECTVFPPIESFKTSISTDVNVELYKKCRDLFNHRMLLPETDVQKWTSMADYLDYYNKSDTYPTAVAMNKMLSLLESQFGLNALITYGLPSFGLSAMMRTYKEQCPSVISFPDSFNHLSVLLRRNIIGGIVSPLTRHATTNADEYGAPAAKQNSDGQKFDYLVFWDINSMYPCSYKNKQPTGKGFHWTLENGWFQKKLIKNNNASLQSILWLEYMRHDPRFVDRNGERQTIYHSWYGAERNVGTLNSPIYVDGYVSVDDSIYVLEYLGCHVHQCKLCDTKCIRTPEEIEKDNRRLQHLDNKFNLIKISSCEWNKIERSINHIDSPISPLLLQRKVKEEVILEKILNGSLFGFVLIDIFPKAEAKKWELANWGPIFEHQNIDFDMLPPEMQKRVLPGDYPKKTLCQVFHAEKYFCTVEAVKFYHENGFRITKLHEVIEFQGERVIEDFYQKIYEMRVHATIDGNKCLNAIAKNVANARKFNILFCYFPFI